MTEFRFIHTSDLHLGRRFGTVPEEARGRLVEARHGALARLAEAARGTGAGHILVAGDIFDTETPSVQVRRQAMAAMASDPTLTWWLIPGNHDSLAAEPLWDALRAEVPENVRILDRAAPQRLAPGVSLLPAPLPRRYPGRDLTAWMDEAPTPEGDLRVGLAHGAVASFSSEDGGEEIIAPDRAERAGLAYLALGDWHGQKRIGARTWYSGTPEHDRYRHEGRGACLSVTLHGASSLDVESVATGVFEWADLPLRLSPGQDVEAALAGVLPAPGTGRRDTLVQLRPEGYLRLGERLHLGRAIESAKPDFWVFETDESRLATEYRPDDLDEIAEGGALRMAAEALFAEAGDPTLSEEERDIAGAALGRLHAILRGDAP